MLIGRVIGTVWATRKDERLNGLKLLVINPLYAEDLKSSFVAADTASAGVGDKVLITRGSSAREAIGGIHIPIDSVIVGIVDSVVITEES